LNYIIQLAVSVYFFFPKLRYQGYTPQIYLLIQSYKDVTATLLNTIIQERSPDILFI